jgi:hypothetical protein
MPLADTHPADRTPPGLLRLLDLVDVLERENAALRLKLYLQAIQVQHLERRLREMR